MYFIEALYAPFSPLEEVKEKSLTAHWATLSLAITCHWYKLARGRKEEDQRQDIESRKKSNSNFFNQFQKVYQYTWKGKFCIGDFSGKKTA